MKQQTAIFINREHTLNKTKKIVLAVAALCASFSAVAQDAVINPSWYVQPSINGMKPDNDAFGVDKKGYGGGLKFGKALNEQWDVQLGGTYARAKENGERYQQQCSALPLLDRRIGNFHDVVGSVPHKSLRCIKSYTKLETFA